MASGNAESQTAIFVDEDMDTVTDVAKIFNSVSPTPLSGDDPHPTRPPAEAQIVEPPPERNVESVDPDSAALGTGAFDVTIEGEFPDEEGDYLVKITGPEMEGLYWTTSDSVTKNSDSEIVAHFSGAGDAVAGEGFVFVQVRVDGGYGLVPGQPPFTWTEHVAARKGRAKQKSS